MWIQCVKWKPLSRVQLFATPWAVVHGILQARKPEWVASRFSRDLPNPGIEPRSLTLQVESSPVEPRIMEWVAYPSPADLPDPGIELGGLLHCRWILYQLSYQGSPSVCKVTYFIITQALTCLGQAKMHVWHIKCKLK